MEVREIVTAETRVRTLAFELWDSVFDGADWIPYQIESVKLPDGRDVEWVRAGRLLD